MHGGLLLVVSWSQLVDAVNACERCGLRAGCNRVVVGEGNPDAEVMLIGEGPGADEDRLGRPFVGRAGQLLTKMIEAIGMKRDDVYICNIVKCRPPGNRTPTPDEAAACIDFLRAQTALVKPKIIVLLGSTAGKAVIGQGFMVTRDRGKWIYRKDVRIMPTFHPSALLRDEALKRPAWQDFKAVREMLKSLGGNQ